MGSGTTIRAALLLGFGSIFALWLVSTYEQMRQLGAVEQRAEAIHARFTESEEALFTVRTQVLLGSIYLRDALAEGSAASAPYYRQQLERTRADVENALQRYAGLVGSREAGDHWARLRAELDDFWRTIPPILSPDAALPAADVRAFLRDRVIPKREVILAISDQIRALDREAFEAEHRARTSLYEGMRRRAWGTSAITAILGLAIAFVATRYAGRLESQIREQHRHILANTRDLERLSARLVNAQEDERRMIARELHDEIGQALTAIKMELALSERHQHDLGGTARSLDEARAITDRTLNTVRDLSQLLHPSMLDDLGLPDTLKWYLHGFSQRTGVRAELVQDQMGERLAPEVEVSAYRIIQEALTNVAKHAHATLCRVYVQRLPHSFLITIEDDGVGADTQGRLSETSGRGLGLVGIRERASALSGTVRFESASGKGTRLTVELPLADSRSETEAAVAETVASVPEA
jgi:signal transduction histidine kinase